MSSYRALWFSLFLFFACFSTARAFGAGEIPSVSYCKDTAYRHGDIESTLDGLVRWQGSAGGFLGAAASFLSSSGGSTFSKADVKRVYFGNWLRDYSQAMDIAGLSKATKETLLLVLSVLSFMTFGFATEEFELTPEKLGVYLPVEHIDNPKGYGAGEDPRKYHPSLRPPVQDVELETDQQTGMKNYIAKEGEFWDTSAAFVRRSLYRCIELAQRSQGSDSPELFEAYRLMGGALHTLEDLLAHSNWCELSLKKLGYSNVFCFVGDAVKVRAPDGQAIEPLVTGTFGGADFIFSVMGEAQDKLSESSIEQLQGKMQEAQGKEGQLEVLKQLLGRFGGGDDKVSQAEQMQQNAYHFDPSSVASEEVQRQLLDALKWRDGIMRDIQNTIERIPGLEDAVESLQEAVTLFIYSTIQPYIAETLGTVSDALSQGSREVIDGDDQYEVFNNPHCSDPSHSMISKDHFDNILNDPAGRVAKVVVKSAVARIVAAWSGKMDSNQAIEEILETFHHPYFAYGKSDIQSQMAQELQNWFDELGEDQGAVIDRLSKESVKNGENKRLEAEEGTQTHGASIGHSHGNYGGGQANAYTYGSNNYGSTNYEGYGGYDSGYQNQDQSSGLGSAFTGAAIGAATGYFTGNGNDDEPDCNAEPEPPVEEDAGGFDFGGVAEAIQEHVEDYYEEQVEEFYEE